MLGIVGGLTLIGLIEVFCYGRLNKLQTLSILYCSKAPATRSVARNGLIYYYNGIDRINNLEGYLTSNVVTCCKECNWLKRIMTYEQFLKKIKDIYFNRVINGK